MTVSVRLLAAASRVMDGDESSMAAQELEAVLLDEYLDDERTSSLQEGLALYAPGSGPPYVDAPELRGLIAEALEVLTMEDDPP
ncbi:MAG: hypothetical protein ACK5MT_18670 [Actinomycetales bacterium]